MSIELRGVHDAVIALMEGLTASRSVGDNKAPNPAAKPYIIVYSSIGEAERWQSLSGGLAAMALTVQVSIIGENRTSVDIVSDQARTAMCDPTNDLSTASTQVGKARDFVSANMNDDPDTQEVRRDLRFSLMLSVI